MLYLMCCVGLFSPAHTGDCTSVGQPGDRAGLRRPGCRSAERLAAERPPQHLQRAVQSHRCESHSTPIHSAHTQAGHSHFHSKARVLLLCFLHTQQELERSCREYDKLEGDVTLAKTNLLEQLEALGSPQVRSFLSV